ncbi:MAG: carbohydate-binding domain-containing protein [Alteromonadaceae bacterium]|nr:carbohydate-binding domain-containing protein [Alteromonadaceae bacterium]
MSLITLLSACKQETNSTASNNKAATIKTSNNTQSTALHTATQADINLIANSLQVNYHLLTNIPNSQCDTKKADGACFTVELSFTAPQAITAKDWQITFSQISPVQSFVSKEFSIEHINGDLHQISLNKNYQGFKAGETKKLVFRANFWMLSQTDALPNYIVSSNKPNKLLTAKVIASTKTALNVVTNLETLPFVTPFTDEKTQFKRTANDKTKWLKSDILYQRNQQNLSNKLLNISTQIIPTPKQVVVDPQQRQLNISTGLNVNFNNVPQAEVSAALAHLAKLGVKQSSKGIAVNLSIKENSQQVIGSYNLTITPKTINITGVDSTGVFYGLSSLSSLLTLGNKNLPLLTINDQPHYQFRGMMVDVARNFHSKAFILKLIEQMGAYKLNKLHLHLGDDEGWRIEIPDLPELTQISSKRCLTNTRSNDDFNEDQCLSPQLGAGVNANSAVNGYYTIADYQEILRAASANHIQVIPSFDMPGHSRAAVKAMQARYKKYIIAEQYDKATEYLLNDNQDTTQYSSVQYYNDNTLNVCMDSTYHFIEKVLIEVKKIHADAGQPLTRYHIGADETAGAWVESPVCKALMAKQENNVDSAEKLSAYFIERVANMLAKLDIEAAGWSDGLSHTNPKNMPAIVQANAWDVLFWGGHKNVHKLANQNWQIVLSNPDVLYFDFPYEADPKEYGYYWASRHTNTEKIFQFMPDNLPANAEFYLDREDNPYTADDTKQYDKQGKLVSAPLRKGIKFLGIQGQLWSENTRSDTMAEYKIFPRLFALAERAWHQASWAVPYNYNGAVYDQNSHYFSNTLKKQRDQQWQLFANTIGQKELAKLEQANINYRLPTVGAIIKNNILYANTAFTGLSIEYLQQNSVKDKTQKSKWQVYQHPIKVSGNIKVRTSSFNGKRKSRSSVVHEINN